MNALLAILSIFFNPAETVRRCYGHKMAWLAPVLFGGVLMGIYTYAMGPIQFEALRLFPPAEMDMTKIDQLYANMRAMARFQAFLAPIMLALMAMLISAVLVASCVGWNVDLKFPDLYNLVAHAGLINVVQAMVHLAVLMRRGAVTNLHQLQPNFGPEMLLSESAPQLLHGLATFFSVFQIWHIVVLALGFAALTGVSKAKAFLVTAPAWMLGLVIALMGSLMRR